MLSMTQKTPSPELSKEVGTLCFGAVSAKGAGWLQHIERPMDVKSQTRTQRMSLKSFCKEEWAKPTTKDVLLLCFCQQGLFDQVLRHVLLVDQIFISLSDMQISLLFLCNVLNTGFLMDILYIIYVYYIYIIIYNVIQKSETAHFFVSVKTYKFSRYQIIISPIIYPRWVLFPDTHVKG